MSCSSRAQGRQVPSSPPDLLSYAIRRHQIGTLELRLRLVPLHAVVQPVEVRCATTIGGVVVQVETPNWTPLEEAIGNDLAGWFMWMHEISLVDGSRIHAYKHTTTRRYLHLAEDGRAFDYCDESRYGEVALAWAIARALNGRNGPYPRSDSSSSPFGA